MIWANKNWYSVLSTKIFMIVGWSMVVRQYILAKRGKMEEDNRLAMARAFEWLRQNDKEKATFSAEKIADAMFYSTRESSHESRISLKSDDIMKIIKGKD